MNTKKIHVVILVLAVVLFCAAACMSDQSDVGKENAQNITIDITALSDRLARDIRYDDTLEKVEVYVLEMLYDCADETIAAVGYCASGGTAEAIAVFECETPQKAEQVLGKIKTYQAAMMKDYVRYTAGEVTKLDQAILQKEGRYVIFCVSPDSAAAKQIIKESISPLQN